MKYFTILVIGLSIIQCRNRNNESRLVSIPRDTSITRQNAYSDLFLDSLLMEKFIDEEIDSNATRNFIRNFYNKRNFSYAWFNKDGLTVQAEGFLSLYNQYANNTGDTSHSYRTFQSEIDKMLYEDSSYKVEADTLVHIELRLTARFYNYIKVVYGVKVNPEVMQWHIPKRKLNAVNLLDSFLSLKNGDWKPLNTRFYRLRNAIIQYKRLQRNGGWPSLEPPKKNIKPGTGNGLVSLLKKRLSVIKAYHADDTSHLFNDSLLSAIKIVRKQFGLPENNLIDEALIEALNVPVEERIKQMVINLERMKWMPAQPLNYIAVNIPEFRFRLYENGNEVLGMNVVVGKVAHRTVIFSDELEYIVFNPYWNVPRSIVRREIYPAMKRNSTYLQRNNMEITGYYSDSLPIVRQKPGRRNALGKVKFIFPNSYNIYFHDTPAKDLFDRHKRAFSHGCIRLQKPFELAKHLLRTNMNWSQKTIKKAMDTGTEKWVKLKQPLPVFITYFTSWAGDNGEVYFRKDLYGHDKKMAIHLFE